VDAADAAEVADLVAGVPDDGFPHLGHTPPPLARMMMPMMTSTSRMTQPTPDPLAGGAAGLGLRGSYLSSRLRRRWFCSYIRLNRAWRRRKKRKPIGPMVVTPFALLGVGERARGS